ncbi:hypothetical protein N7467_002627 [Penicillium canescens]|nr:hypothetical protein N7467_002627 [Penicillium canescens]
MDCLKDCLAVCLISDCVALDCASEESLKGLPEGCLAGWLMTVWWVDCESEEKKGLPEGLPGWLGDIGLRGSPDCEPEEKAKGAKGLPGW